jgi:ribosomal protein S14
MDRHKLWIQIDKYKRSIFLKNEIKKKILKSIKLSQNVPYFYKYKASYYNTYLIKSTSKTFYINRCVISGRVWGLNKYSNYSRFIFRKKAYKTDIPGLRRSSY